VSPEAAVIHALDILAAELAMLDAQEGTGATQGHEAEGQATPPARNAVTGGLAMHEASQ